MENEEIELLPSGLITCLLNNSEVRILKISPRKLTIRLSYEIENIYELKIAFYVFDEYKYEEVVIKEFSIIKRNKEEFYYTYEIFINDNKYFSNVRNSFYNYSKYAMLKSFGDDNEFSKEMVNYPEELDYEFYKYYTEQKKEWMSDLNYLEWNDNIMDYVELAISLDNHALYKKYMENDIKSFKELYLKENFADNHKLFQKDLNRLYIGNEFCHNLFPDLDLLISMLNKAKKEGLDVTLSFTYIRECFIEKTKEVIDTLYSWCNEHKCKIEIVINDFGMINLVKDKLDYFKPILGVLLNKRKKDPRYIYKKGYEENKELISKNSLNSSLFNEFLKECNIDRYEYENCGYKISIAKGNHSLHIPFYQTNTSQYCPLYAKCTTMDRGRQKLVKDCPKYCKDYVFAYPKHLKMVGKYNSLFAFDNTLLKDSKVLEYYINNGIDRIVLNFI